MTCAVRRRIALLCVVAVSVLGAAQASPAAAQDSSAVAVNTKDNSSIFRLAFNIRRVTGAVVDQTNAAVAISSCQSCRTVAISIQILLVESDPSVVSPTNLALAINQDCTLCDTFASAYQLVLGDGTRLRLTPTGSRSIAQIRREFEALRKQNLSDADLATQVDALVSRLSGVLDTELVGVGQPDASAPPAAPPIDAQPPADTTTAAPSAPASPPTTTAPPPSLTTTAPAPATPADTTTAPAPAPTTP
jgi:hypothetical protein